VARRARAHSRACIAAGRPSLHFVSLPPLLRGSVAAAAAGVALGCQLRSQSSVGSILLALALLCAAQWAPASRRRIPSEAARWLPILPRDVFPEGQRGSVLSSSPIGALCATMAIHSATLVCGAWALRHQSPWLVCVDGCVFVPLWLRTPSHLLAKGSPMASGWLSRTFHRLRRDRGLQAVPLGRVRTDGSIEEVRVMMLPRVPIPGVCAIEACMPCAATPMGPVAGPEIIVRVREGSAAASRLMGIGLPGGTMQGRTPDERVARLLPIVPTRGATIALAKGIVGALADRRVAEAEGIPARSRDRRLGGEAVQSPAHGHAKTQASCTEDLCAKPWPSTASRSSRAPV